jgi:EmrB/QacA subfamily drug resistance transporter
MIPWLVGVALAMQMLDSNMVASALPAMGLALGVAPVSLNVLITAYVLAVAIFVPISSWTADRFGAKRIFLWAIALFVLGSVFCAISQTLGQMIASRILQGISGAMMVPVGRIILLHTVPRQDLLKAIAFLSVPALVGPVFGPPLGGLLVTYLSWHWIFLINIPIGALGIVMVRRHIVEVRPDKAPRLDLIGFLLLAFCMASLVICMEAVSHGSMSAGAVLALAAAGIASAWLYRGHSRRTAEPLIDLELLKVPSFAISVLGGSVSRFVVGATPFLLVMQLQVGMGYTPLVAGMIALSGAMGALAMKGLATRILGRFGFRPVLQVTSVVTGVTIAMCAFFNATTPIWLMVSILLVSGFFRSLMFTAVNSLAYADIDSSNMSRANGFATMATQVGISLGVGIAAATLNLSTMLRGAASLALVDVMVGFLVIGAACAASTFAFRKLDPHAGHTLLARGQD